ncbi:ubiquinone biosynthesis protein COQ4 homolog, mitochondrial [Planococcus citri]|uniref:ubiquinone biosynthesis protein COQ4 homolog, mitochondrial n=1 Tax=Planococcus citri TaxID=170843 RepID=UPI0031F906E7
MFKNVSKIRTISRCTWCTQICQNIRNFSSETPNPNVTFDFTDKFKTSHIRISPFQRVLLGAGSSIMSLIDPSRADMIAIMGETTGAAAINYMHSQMSKDEEGSRILREKPVINSSTIDLEALKSLPDNTLGRAYVRFLEKNKVTPDSRDIVKFIDDVELAYVIQRYREVHDLVHTVLDMPTNMLGEVTVKWVEAFQTRLPLCVFGGVFGAVRLAPKQRMKYVNYYLPWAIKTGMNSKFFMNVYYEQRWDQSMESLLKELNIEPLVLPK